MKIIIMVATKLRYLKHVLLSFLMILSFCSIWSQTKKFTVNNNSLESFPNYLYWDRISDRVSPDQAFDHLIKKEQFLGKSETINDGTYEGKDHWIFFELRNISDKSEEFFFLLNCPYLSEVSYYEYDDNKWKLIAATGINKAFNTRPYYFNDFVLPISIPENASKKILIKTNKRGEIFSIKPQLMSKYAFEEKQQKQYLLLGIIIGIICFNIIVNIFLGIGLKDNIHYKYILYLCLSTFWLLTSVGFDFQFLYPNFPEIVPFAQPTTGMLTLPVMAYLAIDFLKLNEVKNKPYYVLYYTNLILIFSFPFWLFFNIVLPDKSMLVNTFSIINITSIGLIAASIIWAAIVRIKDGFKPAWFYIIALLYLAFSIFTISYKIVINNDLTELVKIPNDIHIGIIIESFVIFFGIIYRYNTFKREKTKLKKQLSEQKLSTANAVLFAQEEERKRLAQDLHDDVGATLSTLLLHISNHPNSDNINDNMLSNHQSRSIEITKKAVNDLRNISHNLIPKEFDARGLYDVIEARINELKTISKIQFNLNLEGSDLQLPEHYAINIFRIVNELLNNILRHSSASKVEIELSIFNNELTLIITDNGVGYYYKDISIGIGIKNVKSRVQYMNGKINIDGNKNGTTIIIEVPLNNKK